MNYRNNKPDLIQENEHVYSFQEREIIEILKKHLSEDVPKEIYKSYIIFPGFESIGKDKIIKLVVVEKVIMEIKEN